MVFTVKMPQELVAAIEGEAERAGMRKSAWVREVLGAVALGGVSMRDIAALAGAQKGVSPHPDRHLPVQMRPGRTDRLRRECQHPVTALVRLPFSVVCRGCGDTGRST